MIPGKPQPSYATRRRWVLLGARSRIGAGSASMISTTRWSVWRQASRWPAACRCRSLSGALVPCRPRRGSRAVRPKSDIRRPFRQQYRHHRQHGENSQCHGNTHSSWRRQTILFVQRREARSEPAVSLLSDLCAFRMGFRGPAAHSTAALVPALRHGTKGGVLCFPTGRCEGTLGSATRQAGSDAMVSHQVAGVRARWRVNSASFGLYRRRICSTLFLSLPSVFPTF
jgi:hypothetical protein